MISNAYRDLAPESDQVLVAVAMAIIDGQYASTAKRLRRNTTVRAPPEPSVGPIGFVWKGRKGDTSKSAALLTEGHHR